MFGGFLPVDDVGTVPFLAEERGDDCDESAVSEDFGAVESWREAHGERAASEDSAFRFGVQGLASFFVVREETTFERLAVLLLEDDVEVAKESRLVKRESDFGGSPRGYFFRNMKRLVGEIAERFRVLLVVGFVGDREREDVDAISGAVFRVEEAEGFVDGG